ncbi:MAG: hypothetical protein AAGU17_09525 [Anaerolineaceae bacterium]|jgi:hypothetical protein
MLAAGLNPDEVKVKLCDLEAHEGSELGFLLSGYDAVIFAAGVDDRGPSKARACAYLYHYNVHSNQRLAALRARVV